MGDSRLLIEAVIGALVFCAISLLSFIVPIALPLMVLFGIALPLARGWRTGTWVSMGFTGQSAGSAIRWGLVAGVASGLPQPLVPG